MLKVRKAQNALLGGLAGATRRRTGKAPGDYRAGSSSSNAVVKRRGLVRTTRMQIVFICNELPPASWGGIGQFVSLVAPALTPRCHAVDVVGVYDRQYAWKVDGCRIMVARPRMSRLERFLRRRFVRRIVPRTVMEQLEYRSTCAALRRTVLDSRVRAVPTLVEWPSYQGQCNWTAPGVCHVLRIHGATAMPAYGGDAGASRYRRREIATARRIGNWIGVSRWSLDEMARVTGAKPARSTVVHNPVRCDIFHPAESKPDELVVLYAGTLCERKGDDRLALAANSFLAAFPQAKLLYVGRHTAQRAEYVRNLVRPELRGRVEIRPNASQETLAEAMRGAAVFAMPSRGETFGMVYAEAMASGVPVVGGDNTGIPEVVPRDAAGLLVGADEVGAIARAVETLLGSAELRQRMGQEGRRIAQRDYSVETCVEKTVRFYEECLGVHSVSRVNAEPVAAAGTG